MLIRIKFFWFHAVVTSHSAACTFGKIDQHANMQQVVESRRYYIIYIVKWKKKSCFLNQMNISLEILSSSQLIEKLQEAVLNLILFKIFHQRYKLVQSCFSVHKANANE